jgi:hypothetical protein
VHTIFLTTHLTSLRMTIFELSLLCVLIWGARVSVCKCLLPFHCCSALYIIFYLNVTAQKRNCFIFPPHYVAEVEGNFFSCFMFRRKLAITLWPGNLFSRFFDFIESTRRENIVKMLFKWTKWKAFCEWNPNILLLYWNPAKRFKWIANKNLLFL